MNKLFIGLASIVLFASCIGKSKPTVVESDQDQEGEQALITEIIQYFATTSPTKPTTLVLDKNEFNKTFNVGRTMDIVPTQINFEKEKVSAIILPETDRDTEIILESASIDNRVLKVHYSIAVRGEKRSFTIVPSKAFTYNRSLAIDSISLINEDIINTYAK